MSETEVEVQQCQAKPAAARRGYRQGEDALCASKANTTVNYRGTDVAVCKIHANTYAKWGDRAAPNARELWGWMLG